MKNISSWSCQILYLFVLSLFHSSPSFAVNVFEGSSTNEINFAVTASEDPSTNEINTAADDFIASTDSAPLEPSYDPLNAWIVGTGVLNLGFIATMITIYVFVFSSEHFKDHHLCNQDMDPYCTHDFENTTEIIRIPNNRLPDPSICENGTCYCASSSTDYTNEFPCDFRGQHDPIWAQTTFVTLIPFTAVGVGAFIYLLCARFCCHTRSSYEFD